MTAITKVGRLAGVWRRSLIIRADGARDSTTWVRWLQGPSDFADLRQPAGRPDFAGVECLRQLGRTHLDWMAAQDGFAGELTVSDGVFEWRRDIDFQPPGPTPDRGRLTRDGDTMIEEGYHEPYIEHWHYDGAARPPAYALRLIDNADGRCSQIVRVGDIFMYARGRFTDPPAAANLQACIAGAGTLEQAQHMVDCEISFGTITGADWVIAQSTLPFREGHHLGMRPSTMLDRVCTADLSADGKAIKRDWTITAAEGDFMQTAKFPSRKF